jgi:hypothetical protein
VCMYVLICVCLYVYYIYIYTHTHTYIHTCMHAYMCMCTFHRAYLLFCFLELAPIKVVDQIHVGLWVQWSLSTIREIRRVGMPCSFLFPAFDPQLYAIMSIHGFISKHFRESQKKSHLQQTDRQTDRQCLSHGYGYGWLASMTVHP